MTVLLVRTIDYDETDTESSSGTDSPPDPKKPKMDLRGPAVERYFNNMEKKIRKFLFHVDSKNNTLIPCPIRKKCCLREFIIKAELRAMEVTSFIVRHGDE